MNEKIIPHSRQIIRSRPKNDEEENLEIEYNTPLEFLLRHQDLFRLKKNENEKILKKAKIISKSQKPTL